MKRMSFILKTVLFSFVFITSVISAQHKQIVRVAPGYATVITCPSPPDLVTVGNVDAFSIQSAGNYVLVKPLTDKGTTNMFIKAGSESFNILLQISDTPDLEVRLSTRPLPDLSPDSDPFSIKDNGTKNGDETASGAKRRPLSSINPKVLSALFGHFKSTNRYTYSVTNSNVIFAVDHMKQIKDKLFVIGTIINNSHIPYDVGFVRFKLIDYARNYLFWNKKIKESEMEPINEYFNPSIKPHSSGRLLFIFDKHGFSNRNALEIKCNEENGRRDLVLEVPGTFVQ